MQAVTILEQGRAYIGLDLFGFCSLESLRIRSLLLMRWYESADVGTNHTLEHNTALRDLTQVLETAVGQEDSLLQREQQTAFHVQRGRYVKRSGGKALLQLTCSAFFVNTPLR